ncbi:MULTISPECIES: hypothetical protein [unclassified Nostoc]|jgi:predicted transcriptional regulator|uniref:hypothetical protein n=1 Tax=unclassified Nostoc TaxID=2593658 RepID=UPI000B950DB3|nr:hypothetical protein [Nostoc sp. 'Peltigera membranacea cyanobiont' 210A]OYD91228.1 hypothetical protein CDG76_28715 [Nostoc sp. 'Peltigera membranacea cyanobiont' 210A]
MSDKEAVIELVKHLPQDVTLREIVQKIEFIAAIREGFDQIDQGQGIPIEQVEQIMDTWTTK